MTRWITKKGKDGENRHIPIQEGSKKRERQIKTNPKMKEINMEKLRKDIERMNRVLVNMEKRAEYENFWAKNEEGAFSIADHIGDKQWEFVEELKRKYGFEELDDNDETVVTLRKGKIIVKTDFGYPNEVANNLIKYFFWIENEK